MSQSSLSFNASTVKRLATVPAIALSPVSILLLASVAANLATKLLIAPKSKTSPMWSAANATRWAICLG